MEPSNKAEKEMPQRNSGFDIPQLFSTINRDHDAIRLATKPPPPKSAGHKVIWCKWNGYCVCFLVNARKS